jgi:hypothetical protein
VSETDLKRYLAQQLNSPPGFVFSVEAARGGTVGCPDVFLLVHSAKLLLPIEVKPAEVRSDLFPSRIRPAQISWHDRFARAGGRARFAFGEPFNGGWIVWVLDDCRRETLIGWRNGIPLSKLTRCTHAGAFDHQAWWRGLADVV